MERNLVPPSHFHCNSSTQNVESGPPVLGQDAQKTSASFKPMLKTPNDFCKFPETPLVAVQRSSRTAENLPIPPHTGSFAPPQQRSVISQDSGYECERLKGSNDCQKFFQQLFDALKEENSNLRYLLQKNLTEKVSEVVINCQLDIGSRYFAIGSIFP